MIPVQVGGLANYVGSHFWNIQDELAGYTEKEGWQDLALTIDPSTLFSISEDRKVGLEQIQISENIII